jgi:hypothetical protein
MSTNQLRAFIWDALAFETTLPFLEHSVHAIKAWHRQLGVPVPADGPPAGDYRRLTNSLACLQRTLRRLIFPIHARTVRRLLLLPITEQPRLLLVLAHAVQLPAGGHGGAHLL